MRSMLIEEAPNVFKERCFDQSSGLDALPIQAFNFQHAKETLHLGVIPKISSPTYTTPPWLKLVQPQVESTPTRSRPAVHSQSSGQSIRWSPTTTDTHDGALALCARRVHEPRGENLLCFFIAPCFKMLEPLPIPRRFTMRPMLRLTLLLL